MVPCYELVCGRCNGRKAEMVPLVHISKNYSYSGMVGGKMVKCPVCEGDGYFYEHMNHQVMFKDKCMHCMGSGVVTIWKRLRFWYWDHVPEFVWDWYVNWKYPDE